MANILVVVGSARKGRVADKVLRYVQENLASQDGVNVTVADLKELDLPFFDNENSPLSPDYAITDEKVQAWSDLVTAADSLVFITPEYNHSMSAIQKNAIDSLGAAWAGKPVTAVAYGWTGGSLGIENFRVVLENLKADVKHDIAELVFMKDLNPDGSAIDADGIQTQITMAVAPVL